MTYSDEITFDEVRQKLHIVKETVPNVTPLYNINSGKQRFM